MTADGETPRRRSDDSVSYRDMVDFVSDQEMKWHTVRAETLMQFSNAIEKLESSVNKIGGDLKEHETWHRDILEKMISQGKSNTIAVWAVVVAALAIVAAIIEPHIH